MSTMNRSHTAIQYSRMVYFSIGYVVGAALAAIGLSSLRGADVVM